ncbi:MAG TPA: glutamate--tRNA ligase family protein [Candidatus Paceibacterota bacterium]|nr:glutamate--tRNA ligase family protein [Candidatus Paceibacterota bacterium]
MISAIKAFFGGRGRVVTRFAPSPTGFLHAGNYRTAVFSYLFSKQNRGKFVLRIEDTDAARSKKEYEDNILESLEWLGLPYDEMHRQSERGELYREHLQRLLDEGKAFISKEENKEGDGQGTGKRGEVIRFKNPNKRVRFRDMIRGEIEFDTAELGDFVIAKSVTEPIFHFAVVLDDYLMGITHVIRGEDHISNTPRQILIQEALGAPTPTYAHLPLVLAHDRSKLSKRHGAQSMTYYRDAGYLPDALLNYMALLGWNPGTEQEIFDLDGLVKAFDLSKAQKGGAIFNEEKLRWINKEHLKKAPKADFIKEARRRILSMSRAADLRWDVSDDMLTRLMPVLIERINTYGDISRLVESQDLDYYFMEPAYDALSLKWKDEADLGPAKKHLEEVGEMLRGIAPSDWQEDKIKAAVWPYADQNGRGNVLWPFRFALSGKDRSPNPFTLSAILGKETTLKRIEKAIASIKL